MAKNILTNVNLNKNELQNAVLQPLATDPTGAKQGQMYYNTTTNRVRSYTGSVWIDVGGGVQTVQTVTGETVIYVDNTDPENPLLQFKIAATQGTGVTLSKESDGLKLVMQDGTTSQKGIVQLDDTPSATENTKAATPKGANITIEKLSTATTGYLATYKISQGGVQAGLIDIPMDFLVKSATTGVVTTEDKQAGGKFSDETKYGEFLVGDIYIDFVINVKSGTATDEHIYILCKKLGKFTAKSTGTLPAGSTWYKITIPSGADILEGYLIDSDGNKATCDIKFIDPTSSVDGAIEFTIAQAISTDLTCVAIYNK